MPGVLEEQGGQCGHSGRHKERVGRTRLDHAGHEQDSGFGRFGAEELNMLTYKIYKTTMSAVQRTGCRGQGQKQEDETGGGCTNHER